MRFPQQHRRPRIHLNKERIRRYLADSAARNSPRWVYEQAIYLEWWRERLNGHYTAVSPRQRDFLERIGQILRSVEYPFIEHRRYGWRSLWRGVRGGDRRQGNNAPALEVGAESAYARAWMGSEGGSRAAAATCSRHPLWLSVGS